MGEVKFSTIDLDFIKDYLRVDYIDDDRELAVALNSAKSIIREHFNKSDYELDEIPYSVTLAIQLIADMYTNKSSSVDNNIKENPVFKRLIDKNKFLVVE